MAKRLYMTNADYVAIAVSPALIMTLVGSLVFFLIEVLYVGQYEARLDYAFALFVFAAVLIARISIEMGSERAALFALPLGIAMFLFLVRFVEHPSPLSHLINLALLGLVWWCAHKLTWDSTVIDDDQDASGEGLMQRIGVDGPETTNDGKEPSSAAVSAGTADNELLKDGEVAGAKPWLGRLFRSHRGPHAPGLWVLYFSLAALPLFGIGQHWIPVADGGRRRYVFVLLLVYVASALALLVTTSFLNLRRYLRQRRVEMPAPIAGTWVGVGAALIVVVMLLAMLIPRPSAEIAISRPPWQAGSPGDRAASRASVYRDGGEQSTEWEGTAGQTTSEQGSDGVLREEGQSSNSMSDAADSKNSARDPNSNNADAASQSQDRASTDQNDGAAGNSAKTDPNASAPEGSQSSPETADQTMKDELANQRAGESAANDGGSGQSNNSNRTEVEANEPPAADEQRTTTPATPTATPSPRTPPSLQGVATALGGLAGVLKIAFYLAALLLISYLIWKYRHELRQALADILRQLRELFSGRRSEPTTADGTPSAASTRRPSFTDFRDPFQTGGHGQLPPEELVRYTFAAFEAWANDRGRPRTPDCTPQELLNSAVDPGTPIHAEARRLVRLYCEVAYASRRIKRETAGELRQLWQMMRANYSQSMSKS